jgi:hypothetical protein
MSVPEPAPPPASEGGPLAWSRLCRSTPPPRPPRRAAPPSTSSVSSPNSREAADEQDVDALLEGIDRVRIDDLWSTPRSGRAPGGTPSDGGTPASVPDTDTDTCTARADTASSTVGGAPGDNTIVAHDGGVAPSTQEGHVAATSTGRNHHHHHLDRKSDTTGLGAKDSLLQAAEQLLHQQQYRAGLFAPPEDLSPSSIAAFSMRTRSMPAFGPSPRSLARRQERLQQNEIDWTNALASSTCVVSGGQRPVSSSSIGSSSTDSGSMPVEFWASTSVNSLSPPAYDSEADFPRLFKVYPCPNQSACALSGTQQAECFYFHSPAVDRRRGNFSMYKPHMCRFIEEAGGCRKADRCPFAHNDFERRYHPDRFGKETCRDFLRGDCPRRYCTFRHEVSGKVEMAIIQIDAMNDKELLQLVLKVSEAKGRALSEKLLRRFGHGKKHSGWRLEGFNPAGRDDQKVKFVSSRVEGIKKLLRSMGEKKWATTLKTSSLRDMMSGVRKVAEEVRERHRDDQLRGPAGAEMHRLIRAVFSSTNWSCHSQEGDNPFLVTPENQNDAVTALERLVEMIVGLAGGAVTSHIDQASLSISDHDTHNVHEQLHEQMLQVASSTREGASDPQDRGLPIGRGGCGMEAPGSGAGGVTILGTLMSDRHGRLNGDFSSTPSSSMVWAQSAETHLYKHHDHMRNLENLHATVPLTSCIDARRGQIPRTTSDHSLRRPQSSHAWSTPREQCH